MMLNWYMSSDREKGLKELVESFHQLMVTYNLKKVCFSVFGKDSLEIEILHTFSDYDVYLVEEDIYGRHQEVQPTSMWNEAIRWDISNEKNKVTTACSLAFMDVWKAFEGVEVEGISYVFEEDIDLSIHHAYSEEEGFHVFL